MPVPERTESAVDERFADRMDDALRALWQGSSAPLDGLLVETEHTGPGVGEVFRGVLGRVADGGTAVGSQVGEYTIVREIGRGGMGVVYEAEQQNPRRPVALKVIRGGDLGGVDDYRVKLFQREVNTLARLKHSHIATIYDAGRTPQGRHFFVMELVGGVTLPKHVSGADHGRKTPLGLRARLELFAEICDAIHYAHQRGVIHRDLKPSNILVESDGAPKVLDFGLARITDADTPTTTLLTEVGRMVGTLPYMSPEQARGQMDEVDTRSDIYSLGVIFHELVTGSLPYEISRSSPLEAVRTICETPPRRPSGNNRALRGDIDTIAAKALEKDPGRRYQSAAELGADVRRHLADEPIAARPASAAYQLHKFAQRNRVLVTSVLGIVLALVAGTIVSTCLAVWALGAEDLAQQRLEQAEDARQLAEQSSSEALAEATRATAFRDFLVRMLSQINPDVARGHDDTLLRSVLDQAADDIQAELAEYPDVQASIHHVIGTVYRSISRYDGAEQHLQIAYDLHAEYLGKNNIETLASLGSLAQLRWDQGRLDQAEAMYEQLIADYRGTLGDPHRDTLIARYSLAGIMKESGRVDEAEEELQDILAAMQAHLDEQDDAVTDAMNGLAVLALERGRLEEAERLLRAVVQRWTGGHDLRHPKTVRALGNLAVVVRQRGGLTEAERLTRESLELNREVFGEDHHFTIQARINLASLLRESSQLVEAETVAREAFEQASRVLGPEHPDTLKAISHLGIILRLTDKLDEAQTHLEDAVALSERLHGRNDQRTLNQLSSLAGLLYEQDKLAEAETIMRRVVDGMREVYGERHIQTITVMSNLGSLLVKMGKLDEAEQILQTVISLTDQAAPPGHWFRWTVRLPYGECLLRMERFEQAERVLLECFNKLTETLGGQHYRTRGAAEKLAELYQAWERPEEAAKYAESPADEPADPGPDAP